MLPWNFPGAKEEDCSTPFTPTPLRHIKLPNLNLKLILRETCLILLAGGLASFGVEAIYYGLTHYGH